ncbi:MAG: HU family DNA-binding protein [Thermomicrobia bacterium]|nr:HU family DNA-binding protein [Thermomicrobia bacterium]MCA1723368.1 HU family DNA-binding protein [Thermomicrobia bacterium]
MHKNEFIKTVAERANVTQADASRVVSATLKLISQTLQEGDKVVLTGFGTFEMRRRSARKGINPQTGKPITIAPSATPGFTASSTFKTQVNQTGKK